jgi:hypothetical protein
MRSEDEFDDFLRRRRRLFDRPRDDDLEPPAELDRLVLRQAREAIEAEPPHRVFRAPRWGMPVALAATLVLAFTVILHLVKQPQNAPAEVMVRPVAREVSVAADSAASAPAAAAAPTAEMAQTAPAAPPANDAIVVDLADQRADAAQPMAAGAPAPNEDFALAKRARGDPALVSEAEARRHAEPPPAPIVAGTPEWRRDSKAWMAEIERLRSAGDFARADAELAEFKRQHRAYATSPDQ